jgi:hypothetical protein
MKRYGPMGSMIIIDDIIDMMLIVGIQMIMDDNYRLQSK